MRKKYLIGLFVSISSGANAQSWSVNPFEHNVFIENKGQFDFDRTDKNGKENPGNIQYAISNEGMKIYFTASGLIYEHDEIIPISEEEMEAMREKISGPGGNEEKEYENKKMVKRVPHFISMNWIGAKQDLEITAYEPVEYYFTYGDLSDTRGKINIKASAYKKIIYKNLYPNIDLEYTFPDVKAGIKYSLILHPGADVSLIKMKYSGSDELYPDEDGNMKIKTSFGDITDHAPISFYEGGEKIISAFKLSGSTVSLMLDKVALLSSPQQNIIIDPWTTMPTFTVYNAAYDVDYDYAGNVYAYGGGNQQLFQEIKFNSTGAIQWVYTTPFLFSICAPLFLNIGCYGDFAVDPSNGSSYIVEGYNTGAAARVLKVNSSGTQVGLSPGNSNLPEMWRVVYDNYNKQLVIGGGGPNSGTFNACTMDTNFTSISPVNILSTTLPEHDIALLAVDNTNNCFMATVHSNSDTLFDNLILKCAADTLLPVSYMVSDNHKFSERYSVEYVGPGTPIGYAIGMNGMAVSNDYLYTYDGSLIQRWNKNTGALIDSVTLFPAVLDSGRIKIKWGGIAIDNCHNIYVGMQSSILQLDTNFTVVSTIPLANPTDTIYDLKLGSCNEIYACGKYFVSAFASVAACSSLNLFIASVNTCTSTGSATANATGGGGQYSYLWSPGGQPTQTITGLSSGTYTVVVTDTSSNCPSTATATVTITQPPPMTTNMSVTNATCGNSDGSATETTSGGNGALTYLWSPTGQTTATATGLSAGTYIVTITDSSGCAQTDTAIVNNANGPTATLSQNNILCNGQCTGAAVSNISGGTSPFTYLWSSGATTQNIFNLCAGTYTFTVSDSAGCVNIQSVTITQPSALTALMDTVHADCDTANGIASAGASGGTPGYTYVWSSGQTTQVITGLSAGTYTVTITDANGCTITATAIIIIPNGPMANVSASITTITTGQTSTLTATGGGTYLWSNGQTTSSIIVSPTVDTDYCVTVADANQCTDTACIRIFVEDNNTPCPTNKDLTVPNAFSPNNDGQNDEFCLEGWNVCIKDFIVHIYDRWGEEVFESNDPDFCWDGVYKGKPMDAAVFVYYIEAELTTSEEVVRKGNVSLIR
jgi:gliding motility-associated-like protein